MIKINNELCTGCGACASICSPKAIEMVDDERGFVYPKINELQCVNCGMCDKVCYLDKDFFLRNEDCIESYFGRIKDSKILFESSSGGAFTAISSYYVDNNYYIFGARYDKNLKVYHDFVTNKEDLKFLRKSKYVQSDMSGCFEEIYNILNNGGRVLFSGVSCQIVALKAYLKAKKCDDINLVTLNVLCHGVPSQALFDKYIKEKGIIKYQFRNKKINNKNMINTRTALITYDNGKQKIRNKNTDAFLRGYYSRLFYRDSCYNCQFSRKERISDFTILDAWHIERIKHEINPVEGYSIILFNTKKSKDSFNYVFNAMKLEKLDNDWTFSSQSLFSCPTKKNKNRDLFFSLLSKTSFRFAIFISTYKSIIREIADYIYNRISR